MDRQKTQLALLFFSLSATISTLCSCLPSEFSILSHDSDEFTSEERVVELFQQWKEKHGKVYKEEEEIERRFENFRKNVKYVTERNSKRGSEHVVGLNKFADMSNEEFREVYLSKISKPLIVKKNINITQLRKIESNVETCKAPSSLDWRERGVVTGVKDQDVCGSCWAFSSTGAIEGINAIVTGDLISLSEQELVDCDKSNEGCDGGYMDYAFEWIINNGGIDTESDYPYTGYDGICSTYKEESKIVRIDGYKDVAPEDNALVCAVVNQPISVGIDGSTQDFQLYTGGIYNGDCSSNPNDIDHAVLIVGYASEESQDYWIVKNSWGTLWGMDGYIYIRRNTDLPYGVCAINYMASYPTKISVTPSPYPSPSVPPTPPPTPPPSLSPPYPSQCGDYSYCPSDDTCCCINEFYDICSNYGCCEYDNAVCCTGTIYCCPHDYPICDVEEGLCLKSQGDFIGVSVKNRRMAKLKFPWTKFEETTKQQPLQWKRNQLVASG